MKLFKKLLPITGLAAVAATSIPLASCSCGGTYNLMDGYTPQITPAAAVQYKSQDEATKAYLKAVRSLTVSNESNDADYKILKDDARYAYSLGLHSDNFKNHINGKFSSYTLDFEDIDPDDTNNKMSLKFKISVKGGFDDSDIKVEDADLTSTFWMVDPFLVAFNKGSDGLTNEGKNYLSFTPQNGNARYILSGKCKIGTVDYSFNNTEDTCDITVTPTPTSTASVWCGYMIKEFVLTGLTCNYKDLGEGEHGGALYTNYMSLADYTE